MDKEKTIHAYKGFDKDLRCKGLGRTGIHRVEEALEAWGLRLREA